MSKSQFSLFDAPTPPAASLAEAVQRGKPADKPASKAQTAFRRLIGQLDARRESLGVWQAFEARYRGRLTAEWLPAQAALRQVRKDIARLLDSLLAGPGGPRGKSQRRKLRLLLLELLQDLLLEEGDTELEALHDRHSQVSHADLREQEMALSRVMVEDLLGVELGEEHGARNFEELFAEATRQYQGQAEQPRGRRRRESEAARAKREQAEKEISQSVRDVYRKLASALHPDRETDAALRDHKTLQMQRANQAYEAGDLLQLLTLQLEIEQIDAGHLASLPETRLAHYNKVLRQQLAELDAEVAAITAGYRMALQIPPFATLKPEDVDRALSGKLARLARMADEARADLEGFRDPACLAQALKDYHPESDGLDELAAMAKLAALLEPRGNGAGPRQPRNGGRKKPRRP